MQIRTRLTYLFIIVVALILFISSIAIYFFSADYRKDDFYTRLSNKANNISKLLIEIEEVDATLLKTIEKDNPASLPEEKIIIYNYQDEVLYSSDENRTLNISPEILNKIRVEEEIRYKQGKYEVLGFLFADKFDRFVVVAAAVDIYGLKKLKNLRIVLSIVFGISIIFVFISGWIYSGRALKPISDVIEQVNNISITNLNVRVYEGNGKDEIAKLAHTFNKMLDRLESAFFMQKNLIANVSHELRTPLTAIIGQLEVAMMNERSNKEYKLAMNSALEDIKNLNQVSNKLLLLAQTSSETAAFNFLPIRIDDVIWQVRSELIRHNPEYRIKINLDEKLTDEKQLTIIGNKLLIKTCILNLIENGCKYNSKHELLINLTTKTNQIILQFIDEGIGIEPEDLVHIFEPFYRCNNALAIKGHGIGLSLVERILKLHGGNIEVSSKINQGTTFTISFPTPKF